MYYARSRLRCQAGLGHKNPLSPFVDAGVEMALYLVSESLSLSTRRYLSMKVGCDNNITFIIILSGFW